MNFVKKFFLVFMPIVLLTGAVYAQDYRCGADYDGDGYIDETGNCTSGVDVYGTPDQLCPLESADCTLEQYRCPTTDQVYANQATCEGQCYETSPCETNGYGITRTGSGESGWICVDHYLYARLAKVTDSTYYVQYLDTSPGGSPHWNCESSNGGDYGNWHTLETITFDLPVSVSSVDPQDVDVHLNVGINFGYGSATTVGTLNTTYHVATFSSGGAQWTRLKWAYEVTVNAKADACPIEEGYSTGVYGASYASQSQCSASCTTGSCAENDDRCIIWSLPTGDRYVASGNTIDVYDGFQFWDSDCECTAWDWTLTDTVQLDAACSASGSITLEGPGVISGRLGFYVDRIEGWREEEYGDGETDWFSAGDITINRPPSWICLPGSGSPGTVNQCNGSPSSCSVPADCDWEPVCPTGYDCDCSSGTPPDCPAGGTLDTAADKCFIDPSTLCPSNFTYDAVGDACVTDPGCPSGGAYNPADDRCEANPSYQCPGAYSYSASTGMCEYAMSCPSGSTWDSGAQTCKSDSQLCPAGYGYDPASGECYINAACSAGVLNTASDLCENSPQCPSGTIYNSSTDQCEASPSCASGSYNSTTDRCEATATPLCPSGYTWNGSVCEMSPDCPAGTTFYPLVNGCYDAGSCASPYSFSSDLFGSCVSAGEPPISCNSPGTYDAANKRCVAGYTGSCPSGYSPTCVYSIFGICIAWICTDAPYCTDGGTYYPGSPYNGQCSTEQVSCRSGYSIMDLAPGPPRNYQCVGAPPCTGGALNTTTKMCEANPASWQCPSGMSYDSGSGICVANASCPSGTLLDTATDICTANASCAGGLSLNEAVDICVADPACKSSTVYNSLTDRCEVAASGACPSGTTYDSATGYCTGTLACPSPGNVNAFDPLLCETPADVNCPANYTYDPTAAACSAAAACTEGTLSTGLDKCAIGGDLLCPSEYGFDSSQDLCLRSPVCPGNSYDSSSDLCCDCSSDYACLDTSGAGNYQCSPNSCTDLEGNPPTESGADLTYYRDDGTVDPNNGQCVGEVYIFNGQPMECRPAGVQTAGAAGGCCVPDSSGPLGVDPLCSSGEAMTVAAINAGRSHYVGTYCKESWWGIGCVQSANTYCVFGSKLGRIVHEQGRTQLQAFQPNGRWMDTNFQDPAAHPYCKGFTPEEFQMLDFSRIDISEYFSELAPDSSNIQQNMQQRIQDFYDTTQ